MPQPLYRLSIAARLLERAGTVIVGERACEIVTHLSARDALREVIDAYEAQRTLDCRELQVERDRLIIERNAWKREWAREAARREEETGALRRRIVALETDCERQRQELAAVHNVNATLGNLTLRYMPAGEKS